MSVAEIGSQAVPAKLVLALCTKHMGAPTVLINHDTTLGARLL